VLLCYCCCWCCWLLLLLLLLLVVAVVVVVDECCCCRCVVIVMLLDCLLFFNLLIFVCSNVPSRGHVICVYNNPLCYSFLFLLHKKLEGTEEYRFQTKVLPWCSSWHEDKIVHA